jgi:hypothetical protein
MADEPVTRREFDKLDNRVTLMDTNGTRGVLLVQERLADVAKDVTKLDAEMRMKFEEHERQHGQERRDRISGRRWLVSVGIAGLVAMVAVITLLVDLVRHAHG